MTIIDKYLRYHASIYAYIVLGVHVGAPFRGGPGGISKSPSPMLRHWILTLCYIQAVVGLLHLGYNILTMIATIVLP